MIRTFKYVPAGNQTLKSHFVYSFIHHDMLVNAYDEVGRRLYILRKDIGVKYDIIKKDRSQYVYYMELIQSLEKQFARTVAEGLHNGSVEIIKAASVYVDETERKVA